MGQTQTDQIGHKVIVLIFRVNADIALLVGKW